MPDLDPLPEDWDTALFVVAHPDDIEYGLACAAAKWTSAGQRVVYVLATSGEAGIDTIPPEEAGPLREEEERAGAAEVGVDAVEFLGLPDGTLEAGLPLRRTLAEAIRRHRPDMVASINFRESFGGRSFNHADHRAVGWALLDAVRDAGNRWVFTDLIGEGAQPWNGVRMACFGGPTAPTHGVDVTGHLEAGIRSLEAHKVYLQVLGSDFDPRTFLTTSCEAAGAALGVQHAVSFEVFEL